VDELEGIACGDMFKTDMYEGEFQLLDFNKIADILPEIAMSIYYESQKIPEHTMLNKLRKKIFFRGIVKKIMECNNYKHAGMYEFVLKNIKIKNTYTSPYRFC